MSCERNAFNIEHVSKKTHYVCKLGHAYQDTPVIPLKDENITEGKSTAIPVIEHGGL
jgi:hypothetical protein